MEAGVLVRLPERNTHLMYFPKVLPVVLFAAMGSLGYAQAPPKIKNKQIEYTSPADGPGMFREYCATCHGIDGTGTGPAAPALKKEPANLTLLTRKNDGKFPTLRVQNFIQGEGAAIAAHGSRDMPIWGTLFRALDTSDPARARLRVKNLIDHVASLQK